LYAGQHERKRIVAFSSAGTESVIAEGIQTHHLTVTSRNDIYFTEAPTHKVWLVDAAGRKHVVHERMDWPRGVRASTDESLLLVNDPRTNWIWSFLIQNDGSLINGRPTYHLGSKTDAGGMTFDSEGFLYVATKFGVPGNRPAGPGDGHHRRARERGPIQMCCSPVPAFSGCMLWTETKSIDGLSGGVVSWRFTKRRSRGCDRPGVCR
jgi:sugar lactone lactonase YvrE